MFKSLILDTIVVGRVRLLVFKYVQQYFGDRRLKVSSPKHMYYDSVCFADMTLALFVRSKLYLQRGIVTPQACLSTRTYV